MRLMYAGEAGTVHSQAYMKFLGEIGETTFVDVAEVASTDLSGVAVLVVDAPWQHPQPEGVTLEHLSVPAVLVGTYGVKLGESLHLKLGTNYGCMCLAEDAVVWDAAHPVFAGVSAAVVEKPTPPQFLGEASKAILDVRETLPALRVLREPIGIAGQVTAGFGFADSPDCEVIAGGFNDKTQEHFAIGRQARFLQWGFAGSPDDLTPEGRFLLASCIRYITRFADDPVRAFRTAPARPILQMLLALEGWRGTGLPAEMQAAVAQSSLSRIFAGTAPAAAGGERAERLAWYDEHAPYIRNDGAGFYVDTDAQALGFPTNDPAFLEACLKSPDERTARLWERYTGRPLEDVAMEAVWLAGRREHLYFTDWGGFRWVSALDAPAPIPPAQEVVAPLVSGHLGAARYGDEVRAMLVLEIPAGHHAYAPGATDGLPLEVGLEAGFELLDVQLPPTEDGHLLGQVTAIVVAKGSGTELAVRIRAQLCDDLTCYAPQTLELRCPIAEGAA